MAYQERSMKQVFSMKRVLSLFLCCCVGLSPVRGEGLPSGGDLPGIPSATMNLRGIRVNDTAPLQMGFVFDRGEKPLDISDPAFSREASRLIRYFLAGLTVPDGQVWVNLSPYEKDRIIPEGLGATGLGRDMLAQDYCLKRLMSTLLSPGNDAGRAFWTEVYQKLTQVYGRTDLPIDAFSKVWIKPARSVVREDVHTAAIVESRLMVMLDEDYTAWRNTGGGASSEAVSGEVHPAINALSRDIMRTVIVPVLEKEINEGRQFFCSQADLSCVDPLSLV
jgi:hypothetical protein